MLTVVPNLFWRPSEPLEPHGLALFAVDATGDFPGATREGDLLARIWQQFERPGRDAATREALMPRLPGASWLHVAGHATVDDDRPFLSGLELARGQRLTKMDLRGLTLSGPTVFLNACGAGRVARSGGGTLGIADGFVASGARAVVATLWDVPDRLSPEVSERFYQCLEAENLAPWLAISRVQRDLARGRGGRGAQQRSLWSAYQVLGTPSPRGRTAPSVGG